MKILHIIYLLFFTMTLVACDNKGASSDTTLKVVDSKQPVKYPGKPSAPIEMRYEIVDTPELGLPLSIQITLIPGIDAENLRLTYSTSADLVAGDNLTEFNYPDVIAHQPIKLTINVIPQVDGLHYVNLIVRIDSTHSRAGVRSFAIPVSLGNEKVKLKLPKNTKVEQTPAGERLIIKKAKENRNK